MIYTDKIKKAISFAINTHEVDQRQKRNGKDDVPYITHPLTVGLILSLAGANENTIVAGILHDTIEDSIPDKKVTQEILKDQFGEEVSELVFSVTELDKKLPWEVRKQEAFEHIQKFNHNSILLKSADIISNMSDLLNIYKQEGEDIWKYFGTSKENLLNNTHRIILAIFEKWPENPLQEDLKDIMMRLINIRD